MLGALVLLLTSIIEVQCAPSVMRVMSCDENACNATCQKQFQGSFGVKTIGKCDNNVCQCYRSAFCDASDCAKLCRERYSNETDMRSECLGDVCNCAWKGTCVLADCKRQCAEKFPGQPNVDVKCKDNLCMCEWTDYKTESTKSAEPPYVDIGRNKNSRRLDLSGTFQLDEREAR